MFSLSGKVNSQIPCFPCAVATLNNKNHFRSATGQQAMKNNEINYEVIQVAKETYKQENIVETWLSIPTSENNLKRGNNICNREIKCNMKLPDSLVTKSGIQKKKKKKGSATRWREIKLRVTRKTH